MDQTGKLRRVRESGRIMELERRLQNVREELNRPTKSCNRPARRYS